MKAFSLLRFFSKPQPPQRLRRAFSTSTPYLASDDKPAYPPALPHSALAPQPPARKSKYQPRPNSRQTDNIAFAQRLATSNPRATPAQRLAAQRRTIAELERTGRARDLERQSVRRWRAGDVYAPHDLSPVEMTKWRRRRPGERDAFDVLGLNPADEWKNFAILSEYVSPLGRIKHRRETGLRAVNQRRIARAVRRAVGMGLLPSVHKHPEMLEVEARARNERRFGLDGKAGGGVLRQ